MRIKRCSGWKPPSAERMRWLSSTWTDAPRSATPQMRLQEGADSFHSDRSGSATASGTAVPADAGFHAEGIAGAGGGALATDSTQNDRES